MTHNLLPLTGKNFLITSGSTRAYLDAVRYISNISTGRLGREIATEALIQIARTFCAQCKANLIVANRLEDIKDDTHTAYFVNNKGELTGVFHNKKAIAEGLMKLVGTYYNMPLP